MSRTAINQDENNRKLSSTAPDPSLSTSSAATATSTSSSPNTSNFFSFFPPSLLIAIFVYIIIFLATTLIQFWRSNQRLYISSSMGILSGGYVIVKLFRNSRDPAATLLFYRTICDVCIAIRLMSAPAVKVDYCGDDDNCDYFAQNCQAFAFIFEFFEIAAEAWFLCMALDLAITMINPFSSFRQRVKYYHVFCWGISILFASLVYRLHDYAGVRVINKDNPYAYLCWIRSGQFKIDSRLVIFLYLPIAIAYTYALYVLFCARRILQRGLSVTFLHRVRTLDTSTKVLVVFLVYTTLSVIFGFLAHLQASFYRVLIFFLSSKGCFCFFIYLMIVSSLSDGNKTSSAPTSPAAAPPSSQNLSNLTNLENDESSFMLYDLNHALQHEVVTYATVGIQQCAQLADRSSDRYRDPPLPSHSSKRVSSRFNSRASIETIETTLNSQEQYVLEIFVPSDNYVIDQKRFRSLARGPLQELENELKKVGKQVTIPALRRDIHTKFLHDEDVNENHENQGIGEIPRDSSCSATASAHSTSQFPRGNSWRISSLQTHVSEEKQSKLTHQLLNESSIETRHLSGGNLLSSMDLSVKKTHRPRRTTDADQRQRASQSLSQRSVSTLVGLPAKLLRAIRAYPVLLDHYRGVVFTEYCPTIFRDIRHIYGIQQSYPMAFRQPLENRATKGGASNALFFYSKCNQYIVKSCTPEEMKQICTKASSLLIHFQKYPGSYLTKIFGAYKLQMYACDLYFIVTNNVLLTRNNEIISEKYDLKGSSINRNMTQPKSGQRLRCKGCGQWFIYSSRSHANTRNRNPGEASGLSSNKRPLERDVEESHICSLVAHEPDSILKDNDLRGRSKFRLQPKDAEEMLNCLRIDAEFLANTYSTMDYSLLVGVSKKIINSKENLPPNFEPTPPSSASAPSTHLGELGNARLQAYEYVVDYSYYFGIIDYQQRYTWMKKLENWIKIHVLRQPKDELSCIDPQRYRQRFIQFIEDLVVRQLDPPSPPPPSSSPLSPSHPNCETLID